MHASQLWRPALLVSTVYQRFQRFLTFCPTPPTLLFTRRSPPQILALVLAKHLHTINLSRAFPRFFTDKISYLDIRDYLLLPRRRVKECDKLFTHSSAQCGVSPACPFHRGLSYYNCGCCERVARLPCSCDRWDLYRKNWRDGFQPGKYSQMSLNWSYPSHGTDPRNKVGHVVLSLLIHALTLIISLTFEIIRVRCIQNWGFYLLSCMQKGFDLEACDIKQYILEFAASTL